MRKELLVGLIGTVFLALLVWLVSFIGREGRHQGAAIPNLPRQGSVTESQHQNRLASEKSPYLLQHARNPVDWYPWGDEAFEKARREDKPVFLSIGYSTCHWCHVMEHESFEDSTVAELMKEAFVSVKVDREERPDVDNIYMDVCQMMTGSGGWPLTIIMTPDKKPFFAGTYIPKENAYGRLGMIELIPRIVDLWKNRRQEAMNSAEQISSTLRSNQSADAGVLPDVTTLHAAKQNFQSRFDSQNGGFGRAPKFPTPHNLTLLLRYWKRTGDASSLNMVEETLKAMRRGGIYDHVGFGFHRYSTDAEWLVPHFEKMLYDQALLVMAYTETYQATGNEEYAKAAQEILTYVMRDLTSPEGAFWSAEDADSEGEEGKFYLWSVAEVRSVLSKVDADLFIRAFGLTDAGNFVEQGTRRSTGTNIPHLTRSLSAIAAEEGMTQLQLEACVEAIRQTLFAVRKAKIHPYKDDKVLTDWNGLMIAAISKAAQAFDRPDYAEAARRASAFVMNIMRGPDGRLVHRYRDGEASLAAHVDDYAFMVWGLIELYEATFDVHFLREALTLNRDMIEHFWDGAHGGFFFTADDSEELLVRPKESYDGAVPSGNSVAMSNLMRLGRITGDAGLEKKAETIGRTFSSSVWGTPSAHSQLLQAVDFLVGPTYEIIICGVPGERDTDVMLQAIRSSFIPNKIILFKPTGDTSNSLASIAAYTLPLTANAGKATAYVCRDFACQLPTNDPVTMLSQLQPK